MRKSRLMALLCFIVNITQGQALKQLNIGDTLPSINVSYLNGDKLESKPLSTFYKSNFLIIDFWANWCGACIRGMEAADSISKKFNGAIKILPVTYQDKETVQNFVQKNEILNKLHLNYVVNDSVLMGGYFKFVELPHEVWIDTNGVVKAITYADEISTESVKTFINNEPLLLPEKRDVLSYDYSKPLPVENDSFLYRSILTHFKRGFPNSIGTMTAAYLRGRKVNKFTAINKDILSMFYAAYSESAPNLFMNRIELHINDTLALSPFLKYANPDRKTIEQNSFCYELVLPEKISKPLFYAYLLEDLNRLFPFKASFEKRKKVCWIVTNKNKALNPSTKGMPSKMIWKEGFLKDLNNQTMDVLVSYLNWEMDSIPVIDETKFKGSFDLELDATPNSHSSYLDSEKIKKSLNKYGFDLQKAFRMVNVLVIKEKHKKKPA